jgi:hypothetical protein
MGWVGSYASVVEAGDRDSRVRLAEVVAAFSLATDLGMGQPMEHVLRSWLIAARMGDYLDLDADERASLYYVVTLAWVGCVADTREVAAWFGDDIAYRRDSYSVDLAGLPMLGFVLRHAGAGSPPLRRLRLGANLIVNGRGAIERGLMSHCLTTAQMAERLGLGSDVCEPLQQVFTRWDGKGVPGGVGGEAITQAMRLFHLADIVEVFHRDSGIEAAIEVARARRGTHFDPSVDLFCDVAGDVLVGIDARTEWDVLIEDERGLQRCLTELELDAAFEAVADFTDLRSPSRAGHSRGVADLAAKAGELCGLPPGSITTLRRAGLVHDIGMHGIPATILDSTGPLSGTHWERMRLHSYYTERMLSRPPARPRSHRRARRDGHRAARRLRLPPGLERRCDPDDRADPRRRRRVPRHD